MIRGALTMGRAAAESRMTETCTVSRPGPQAWNPTTLQYDASTVTVYSGPCRVKRATTQDHGEDAADQVFVESQYILHLPVATSGGIAKDDTVTITACPDDADLVGRTYAVIASPAYSQGTARRVPVRETQ